MMTLYWVREDGQGSFDMGSFASKAEAEGAIPSAKAELINQCPGPCIETNSDFTKCRDEIEDGSWSVIENNA